MPVADKPRTKRTRRMARTPQVVEPEKGAEALPSPAPRTTKTQMVVDLLGRSEGCSLQDLVNATGWQAHTARAALTGLKKKGHGVTSHKPDAGPRIYRIVSAGVSA